MWRPLSLKTWRKIGIDRKRAERDDQLKTSELRSNRKIYNLSIASAPIYEVLNKCHRMEFHWHLFRGWFGSRAEALNIFWSSHGTVKRFRTLFFWSNSKLIEFKTDRIQNWSKVTKKQIKCKVKSTSFDVKVNWTNEVLIPNQFWNYR